MDIVSMHDLIYQVSFPRYHVGILQKNTKISNKMLQTTYSRSHPCEPAYRRQVPLLSSLFWRLPTLPRRVPSALVGLTSVFGMRTGITPLTSHQNNELNS